MNIPKLTSENYYSDEMNRFFMSYSQYKSFVPELGGCEAQAMAKLWGGWSEPESDALLFGNYVHSWNDGTMEKFKAEHEELFSTRGETKGQLKAIYKVADTMIETLQNDDWCMKALEGEKEVIITAEFAGCWWKCKMDVRNIEAGRFADLKTTENLSKRVFNETILRYEHWIDAYGYVGQMAVYSEIDRIKFQRKNRLAPLIVAVSKEEVPDKAILFFNDEELNYQLEMVEFHMPHIMEVKNRIIQPVRCEKCRYCRETKKVTKILHYSEL
jgi:hypothetical protein